MSVSPSQFARLLRQSKFASYDPSIYQVYTSYGGHVHRGDFGLKRPLPRLARQRNPNILISNIDTPEYQTEWRDAEDEVRRVERTEELGGPMFTSPSRWTEKTYFYPDQWAVDSDYDPSPPTKRTIVYHGMKPLLRMTKKEYQRFLDNVRSYRDEYRDSQQKRQNQIQRRRWEEKKGLMHDVHSQYTPELLEAPVMEKSPQPIPVDLYREANMDAHHGSFKSFLGNKAYEEHSTYGATTAIVPNPHPLAGLNYHNPSRIQSLLTYPAHPGHAFYASPKQSPYLVDPADDGDRNRSGIAGANKNAISNKSAHAHAPRFIATVGGFAFNLPVSNILTSTGNIVEHGSRVKPTELFLKPAYSPEQREAAIKAGRGSFKFVDIHLTGVPSVVRDPGEASNSIPEKLSVPLKGMAQSWKGAWSTLEDPYIPGTYRYVGSSPNIIPQAQKPRKAKDRVRQQSLRKQKSQLQKGGVLHSLTSMISSKKRTK
ncbi:uncharacterized protein EI90DRAFT_3289954 [Cantharellus anzutake]|uniref:uncharacterized protein n=1 Tax=Cantharellus anzutake TaxID=1750568 RepID=UPI001903E110|nr:uncharacterized protein EI90DRAFT_3289954 [Cantharellus anzutake]KAF8330071.1 hypothetical protein EI90DRAFT_3289954 [Cantharellus anzutake]